MNEEPIETARDGDLRLSFLALHRAARHARAIATQTRTAIVVIRDGKLKHLYPEPEEAASDMQTLAAGFATRAHGNLQTQDPPATDD